ncbi:MAG: hypothetical protein IKQ97_02705 [Eubacterium sp.]|nr:hypothetical protein [Eubacterium sp.]
MKEEKNRSGKIIAIISILSVLIICGVVVVLILAMRKTEVTVDLNRFLKTQNVFTGYDTKGSVNRDALFDRNAFLNEMKTIRGDDYREAAFDDYDFNYEKINLSKETGLTNGAKITLTWKDIDPDHYKENFGITFNFSNVDMVVDGLKPIQKVDAFEGVTVSFSGMNGSGVAYIDTDGAKYLSRVDVYADQMDGLYNYNRITLSFDEDEFIAENGDGVEPKSLHKLVDVDGLGFYVTDSSEITKSMVESLQDEYKSHFYDDYEDDDYYTDYDIDGYVGTYVVSDDYDSYYVYVLYKVSASYDDYDRSFYVPYCFSDVTIEDGEISWGDCYRATGGYYVTLDVGPYNTKSYDGFSKVSGFKSYLDDYYIDEVDY